MSAHDLVEPPAVFERSILASFTERVPVATWMMAFQARREITLRYGIEML